MKHHGSVVNLPDWSRLLRVTGSEQYILTLAEARKNLARLRPTTSVTKLVDPTLSRDRLHWLMRFTVGDSHIRLGV